MVGATKPQAHAVVSQRAVDIQTADGVADAVLVYPQGAGCWPAVMLFPDALGLRPVKIDMAKRLAASGYVVLVANPFYRTVRAPVVADTFSFSSKEDRAYLMTLIDSVDHRTTTRDVQAFVRYLDSQAEVDSGAPMGALGFCMGGAMTIQAAAAAPDRVWAAVSFHGGGLVVDAPTSPHKLIAGTNASYHIGIAANDDRREPHAKLSLVASCDAAARPAFVEVYEGANHGWTVPDSVAYDKNQAERAWAATLSLFQGALSRQRSPR